MHMYNGKWFYISLSDSCIHIHMVGQLCIPQTSSVNSSLYICTWLKDERCLTVAFVFSSFATPSSVSGDQKGEKERMRAKQFQRRENATQHSFLLILLLSFIHHRGVIGLVHPPPKKKKNGDDGEPICEYAHRGRLSVLGTSVLFMQKSCSRVLLKIPCVKSFMPFTQLVKQLGSVNIELHIDLQQLLKFSRPTSFKSVICFVSEILILFDQAENFSKTSEY